MKKINFLKQEKFSIRKYNVGAFSVAIAASLLFGVNLASADDNAINTDASRVNVANLASADAKYFDEKQEKEVAVNHQNMLVEGNAYSNETTGNRKEYDHYYMGGGRENMWGKRDYFKYVESVKENIVVEKQKNEDGTTNWKVVYFPKSTEIRYFNGPNGTKQTSVDRDNWNAVYSILLSSDLDFVGDLTISTKGLSNDGGAWDMPSTIKANADGGLSPVYPVGNESPEEALQNGHVLTGDYTKKNINGSGVDFTQHRSNVSWLEYLQNDGSSNQTAGIVDWEAFYTADDKKTGALRMLNGYDESGNIISLNNEASLFGASTNGDNQNQGQGYRRGWGRYLRFGLWKTQGSDRDTYNRVVTVTFTTKANTDLESKKTMKGVSDAVLVGYTNNHNGTAPVYGVLDGYFNELTEVVDGIKVKIDEKIQGIGILPKHTVSIDQTATNKKMSANNMAKTSYLAKSQVAADDTKAISVDNKDFTFLSPIHPTEVKKQDQYQDYLGNIQNLTAEEVSKMLAVKVSDMEGWQTTIQPSFDNASRTVTFNVLYTRNTPAGKPTKAEFDDVLLQWMDYNKELIEKYSQSNGALKANEYKAEQQKAYAKLMKMFKDNNLEYVNNADGLAAVIDMLELDRNTVLENAEKQSPISIAALKSAEDLHTASKDDKFAKASTWAKDYQMANGKTLAENYQDIVANALQNSLEQQKGQITAELATMKNALDDVNNPLWRNTTDESLKARVLEEYTKLTDENALANYSVKSLVDLVQQFKDDVAKLDGKKPNQIKPTDALAKLANKATGQIDTQFKDNNANVIQIKDKDGNVLASFAAQYQDVLDETHKDSKGNPLVIAREITGYKQIENDLTNGIQELAKPNFDIAFSKDGDLNKLSVTAKDDKTNEALSQKHELDLVMLDTNDLDENNKPLEAKMPNENNADHLLYDYVNTKPLTEELAKENTVKAALDYTNASADLAAAYDKAVQDAKDFLANPNAKDFTSEKVTEHLNAVLKAKNALDGKPADKTALKQAIVDAEQLMTKANNYLLADDAKKEALQNAIKAAKQVDLDPLAKNKAVTKAMADIKAAIDALNGQEKLNKVLADLEDQKDKLTDAHYKQFKDGLTGQPIQALSEKDFSLPDYDNLIKQTVEDDLQAAKRQAIADLDKIANLNDATKASLKNKIMSAEKISDLTPVLTTANEISKNVDDTKDLIDALKNLSADEKQAFKDELTNPIDDQKQGLVQTPEVLEVILNKAKRADNDKLANAKTTANAEIDGLADLANELKDAIKAKIADAANIADVKKIVSDAKKQNAANLDDAKKQASEQIKALENLTDEEKEAEIAKLADAIKATDVNNVLSAAKNADATKLTEAKTDAKKLVLLNPNLSDDDKANANKAIDEAANIAKVNEKLEAANIKANENLANAKTKANETIDLMPSLTNKDDFKNEVFDATTIAEVNAIIKSAKQKDALDFAAQKQTAKDVIDALKNLDDAKKEEFKNAVDTALNPDALTKVLKQATTLDADNLAEKKSSVKNAVDQLANLTEEEKAVFLNEIDTADNIDAEDVILAKANTVDAENLAAAKNLAKAAIDQLVNISHDDQLAVHAQIDHAKTIADVKKVVAFAKKLDENKLADSKKQAMAKVAELKNLDDASKNAFNAQIAKVTNKADLPKIVKAAQDLDALNKHKQLANAEIESLDNLFDEDLASFNSEINQAVDHATIDAVVEKAKNKAAKNLADAKTVANAEITNLSHLADNLKEDLLKQLANVNRLMQVFEIVEMAKKLDALAAHKEKAKQVIDSLANLADDEKHNAKMAIDACDDMADVDLAVKKAKETDLNNLNKQKTDAHALIESLAHLTDAQKQAFYQNIADAKTKIELAAIIKKAKDLDNQAKQNSYNNTNKQTLPNTANSTKQITMMSLLVAVSAIFAFKRKKKNN